MIDCTKSILYMLFVYFVLRKNNQACEYILGTCTLWCSDLYQMIINQNCIQGILWCIIIQIHK